MSDPRINEVDGKLFLALKDWASSCIQHEGDDIGLRYEVLLENVNYHMSEASKQFGVPGNKSK